MIQFLNETCQSSSFFLSKINVTYPKVSNCYQHIVPYWIPCLTLWIMLPPWIVMLNRKKFFIIKISVLLVIKSVFILFSIINEIVFLVREYDSRDNYLQIGCLSVVHYERFKGLPSGGLVFIFWVFLSITSVVSIYSKIIEQINQNENFYEKVDIYLAVKYSLIYINLILSCIKETHTTFEKRRKQGYWPQYEVSILSRLSFWWLNDLILAGTKKNYTIDDFFQSDDQELTKPISERLEPYWNKLSHKYLKKLSDKHADDSKYTMPKTKLKESDENVKFVPQKSHAKINKPSLGWCIFKAFKGRYLIGAFLKINRDILVFVQSMILGKLIRYIKNRNEPLVIGVFYSLLFFIVAFLQSGLFHHYFDRMFNVGNRIKIALMDMIYKKSLRLSNSSRKESTVGQMVNILAVNAHSFAEIPHHVTMCFSATLSITLAVLLLWEQLGIAAIAGVVTMFILLPVNSYLMNQSKKLHIKKLKHQDTRVKIINELLNGIKIVKLYAWELCFKKIISATRVKEVKILKDIALLNTISFFAWTFSPFLVSVVSFGIFVFIDEKNELTAEKAFVSLSLFNSLKHPLAMLPTTISTMIQAQVSLRRITEFLLKEEIEESSITNDKSINYSILMEDCNFGWDYEDVLLKNINMKVDYKSLTSIIGGVGQGKSSLLSAILGEMEKFSGKINVNGSIAYAPQQPWIQNSSIRDNILFGKEFDKELYEKVIDACALKSDLEILKFGDLTEIGEKGINLSGGQKQRISLARCVYSNADLYLLDDSLSAVDAHVGKHIFDSVIGPNGLLKDKTRIFVTNSLNFLSDSDNICLFENGSIVDSGRYEVLLAKNGSFSNFIKTYLESKESNFEEVEQDKNPSKKESNGEISNFVFSQGVEIQEKDKLIRKEKVETGNVKSSIFMNYFKACNIYLVCVYFFLYALAHVFQILSSFWLSHWTNSTDSEDRFFNFGIYFLFGMLNCLSILIGDFILAFMYTKAANSLHESLLNSILRCGMQFFESTPIGRILNRFAKDMEAIETKVPDCLKSFSKNIFLTISVIVVILATTPLFGIVLIPILGLFIFFQRYYAAFSRQVKRLESVSRSPIYAFFGECLNGVSTIRAFKAQERYITQSQKNLDNNAKLFYSDYAGNRWVGLRMEFTGSLIILGTSLFVVLQKDSISAGTAGLVMSYSLTITLALIWTVRSFTDFETNLISAERIKEYCSLPQEAEWVNEKLRPDQDWPTKGVINFKKYSVKYREELDFVLNNIDCSIKSGEKIGIVGRTGAGKSSLTLGLFRILESNYGDIEIDEINIKNIGLHDLRKKLTIIPQDPVLFSGTLRINLDPFGEYSDTQIWNALEHANLKEFVKSLDKKLEFECSEGGNNLSVGQRQLICLTRALLRKTKIMILDEATASIDHNTDEIIQSTIRSQFKECTILTIAHRLNTIMDNDRIMVLDKGRLVEFDSPANLLSNISSIFYSMAKDADLI
nr:ATP-binding cassette subfamily C1-4 [Brachionus rubens]